MYLPDVFTAFIEQHPEIAEALRNVGSLCSNSGPLDQKTQHLIQLGIAVGIASKGGVRSHTRRALDTGATKAEIIQTVLLSATIIGFPAMIAAYGWVQEVFAAKDAG
jgi:4-carboxymuconolactone decarboxylase